MNFQFRPELLRYRAEVMEALAAADLWWLADYRSVDCDHELVLLEIDGIPDEDRARRIARVLSSKFKWGITAFRRDCGDRDWVVVVHALKSGFVVFLGDDPGHGDDRPAATPGRIGDPRRPLAARRGTRRTKPVPPEQMLGRFAVVLQRLSRPTYPPGIYMDVAVPSDGGEDWDGQVSVLVRLRDAHLTVREVRSILPLLDARSDLVRLLCEAVFVARRDWLVRFVADLPPAAASRFGALTRMRTDAITSTCFLRPRGTCVGGSASPCPAPRSPRCWMGKCSGSPRRATRVREVRIWPLAHGAGDDAETEEVVQPVEAVRELVEVGATEAFSAWAACASR